MSDVPKIYRVILQVSDMEKAAKFYSTLLGANGRSIHASRYYFDCGPVILALVDPSTVGEGKAKPNADYFYYSVKDLEAVHRRARELGCLSTEMVHDAKAGEIVKRPWGERSFYALDPFGNRLCFVDEGTLFTGR